MAIENAPEKIVRYGEDDLQEFKELITAKLQQSREEFKHYQEQIKTFSLRNKKNYSGLEDGSETMEKEYLNQMAGRMVHYMKHLEGALARIENKTYGICRKTGKLINKQRLLLVPHATLSIDAKRNA